MRIYRPFLLAFFIGFFVFSCVAQNQNKLYSVNKKAIKYFNNAITFYQNGKYDNALIYLNDAIEKDSNFIEAYLMIADIRQLQNNPQTALSLYKKVISIDANYRPHTFYQAAILEMDLLEFKDASSHLRQYLISPKSDKRLNSKINHLIDQCDFASDLMENPIEFKPINLGNSINSEFDEYANAISTENDMLIFTVKHIIDKSKREVEDFFFSTRKDDQIWQPRQIMSELFNTQNDEGAMVISPNGKLIIFASNRPGGFGRFDLYFSVKDNQLWTKPKNMGEGINTEYWESQPSISSDGRTVFFVSDRKGGIGGSDIYFATLKDDNTFGNPYNLGKSINTAGNEMTPFIHQDAKTLYFVSDGHLGMGGTDIFIARKDNKGIFSTVQNLGYPINSIRNELGIVVDALGKLAYYSSDNSIGFGGFDIYAFELNNNNKPIPVTYMKGMVYDKLTKQKLEVKFELIDLEKNQIWIESFSDKTTGEFLVCVPSGKELGLNAYLNGYLFYSDHFNVGTLSSLDKPFLKDVPMTPLKIGEKIVLKNILFATNSFDLRAESKSELQKIKELLDKNLTLKIEISGHTDNVGDDKNNQILSENRAKSVYNYLLSNGIASNRISFKGYGNTQPIASNNTEEGRQTNRRTEIQIIGF